MRLNSSENLVILSANNAYKMPNFLFIFYCQSLSYLSDRFRNNLGAENYCAWGVFFVEKIEGKFAKETRFPLRTITDNTFELLGYHLFLSYN